MRIFVMMVADFQTLIDLEFPVIIEWAKKYTIGETATKRFDELKPISDKKKVLKELDQTEEMRRIRTEGESFPNLEFEELLSEIKLIPIKNASIQVEGFMRIHFASLLVNTLLTFFDKREKDFPLLKELVNQAFYTMDVIVPIEKVFDRHGKIRDDASEKLLAIRNSILSVRNQINRNFDKEMRRLLKENYLGDTHETFVNERRVLTILSNFKRNVNGTILGTSKSGNLTYIEPQVNVPLNFELEQLLDDERKEIFRILQLLKRELEGNLALIESYQAVLTELDFIRAKTKLAIELACKKPNISDEIEIELIDAYHPILWKNNKNLNKKTLSQHISMDKFSRMLVISGPNAGGKSITLKSVGLLQVMLQSGLLVPIHENSKMCFFQQILSDIGDNQSITNELSTYSYRLKRMKQFLDVANRKTLLLLDEFGTGSDPDLGGALAEAIFEKLYSKKAYGVMTTHYANIKLKADQLKNAVNGCMLFDTDTLVPLFKLSVGQPGSSFTFEVARINGLDEDLIEDAKLKLDERKVNLDHLLNELQKEKNYYSNLNKEHVSSQQAMQKAIVDLEDELEYVESKSKELRERAEENQQLIVAGKKLKSYIEKFNARSGRKNNNDLLIEEIRKHLAMEKSKIEDSLHVEKMKRQISNLKIEKKRKSVIKKDDYNRDKISVGCKVKLIATKQAGTVEEIDGDEITVSFGFMRMKVAPDKLIWLE